MWPTAVFYKTHNKNQSDDPTWGSEQGATAIGWSQYDCLHVRATCCAVVFAVVFIEHRAEGHLGRRVRAPRSGNPDVQTSTTLKETASLKFMNHPSPGPSNRARRRGAAGRMGVLGRRTRGEPTSERSERTSQPPPSTTSGHCLRVRPGSPITYVHDKVVVLKPPARACPPGGLVPSPHRLHGDPSGTRHPPNRRVLKPPLRTGFSNPND